ncbi:MAG: enoyl-CoA hydratase/isomerase family protein [Proteobacteria bacterium]|nr:enoyl-CoA hydratase/isomerase family protein [Pseudomonadota bacterium]
MAEHVRLELAERRATITLDRPDKHNLLEIDDLARFGELIEAVDAAPECRVLIITGTGAKTFCSGIAIGDIAATDWSDNPLERLNARLERVRVPSIAALNGSVYGGACDLALAADFRIGVEGMRLRLPAAGLGVAYNVTGMRRLVERLGLNHAKRILLAAQELSAEALLACGYLDELVAPGALEGTTDRRARRLEELAPRAVQGMKKALNAIARGQLDESEAQATILASFASEDAREGAAAFAEKRKPRFTGR